VIVALQRFDTYMDESSDQQGLQAFAVGAFIGQQDKWRAATQLWRILLKKYNLDYYKASECERGQGQFKQHRSQRPVLTDIEREKLATIRKEFLDVPRQCSLVGVGITTLLPDYKQVLRDVPDANEYFGGTPYYFTYHLVMESVGTALHEAGLPGRAMTDFIGDEHKAYSSHLKDVHRHFKRTADAHIRRHFGELTFADDKIFLALQMADALAFEVRHVSVIAHLQPSREHRQEWEQLRRNVYRIDTCLRPAILFELQRRHCPLPLAIQAELKTEQRSGDELLLRKS
jgi:hypothetical protein